MTRDEIIAANPIDRICRERGIELKRNVGLCPFHEDKNPSFSVDPGRGLWNCHAGCGGGSVIDLIARLDKTSVSDVLRRYKDDQPAVKQQAQAPTIEKIYSYENALGVEVCQALRMRPKSFRQRHQKNGQWVWNMEGVERVLYRLPSVLSSQTVWIVEGEKDAENLAELGFCATCNIGGAGKWLDSYTEALTGKDVVICGDNDAPGQKHVELVFESIAGKVKTARIVKVPVGKDASDLIASLPTKEAAKSEFERLFNAAQVFTKGIHLPLYTLADMEQRYADFARRADKECLNLGKWLPSLGRNVRNLVAGELVTVMADTGVGKTAILQNIADKARPLRTVIFELELPEPLMFERSIAINSGFACSKVEAGYRAGDYLGKEALSRLDTLLICTESKMTIERMELLVNRSELKFGQRPNLVLVDYIGLLQGGGKNRYERLSNMAEDLKVLAKSTNTIVIMASQIHRKGDESPEIFLHDAKDSGSVENSSGLVLGAWRDEKDSTLMKIKILKNTKGRAGEVVECNYNGENLRITERSPIRDN